MKETRAEYLPISKLHPFEGHPFKVTDNEEMDQLTWSILTQGLLTPLVVRPLPDGEYEVVSGHRRLHACKKAGIETVPALITDMDRDAAAIALVDSNLHREKILPSEKAFAYKMKMEAMKRQGQRTDLTSRQVVGKLESADEISDESGRQVQRYIRLTHLIKPLLDMVDEGRIAFTPAVELSYLNEIEQQDLVDAIPVCEATPNLSQACRLKAISQDKGLNPEDITAIMSEQKANQKPMFKIRLDKLREVAPKVKDSEFEAFVVKACAYYYKHQQKEKMKDAR